MSESSYLNTPLYLGSAKDANEAGELTLWRESFWTNIACRDAIENAIREDFDGFYLGDSCIKRVVEQFGPERVKFVLANTMRELEYDGRFSLRNKEWGQRVHIPEDRQNNSGFIVHSHPAVLDGYISTFRREYPEQRLTMDSPQP